MGTTTCVHQERIEKASNGIEHGVCGICHQVRQYNTIDRREVPRVIKLGRINGAVVLPGPRDIAELSAQEDHELEAARKASARQVQEKLSTAVAPANKQETQDKIIEPAKAKQPRIRKRAKKCKKCQFYQIHDEMPWCTSKKCPSHYPHELRPPYRPPAHKLPSDTKVTKVDRGNRLIPLGTSTVEAASELPPFPAFNEQWSDYIKTNWFETYQVLKELETKK